MYRLLLFLLLPAWLSAETRGDTLVVSAAQSINRDLWLAKDKADHLICSAFLVGFGYYVAKQEMHTNQDRAGNLAVGFSFSLGIAKELYDQFGRKQKVSWKDLVADLFGCGFGYALISLGR